MPSSTSKAVQPDAPDIVIPVDETANLVRAIVRGEVDVERLAELGVHITTSPVFKMTEPAATTTFVPELGDVATGVLAFWARGGGEAQIWARVMLGASNIIDLSRLEEADAGDQLLNALWDLSGGEPLDDGIIEFARTIAT